MRKNRKLEKLKGLVKKIPLSVFFFRAGRAFFLASLRTIARNLYWRPFLNSARFRAACFDTAPANAILMSNVDKEVFAISSNDRFIGRDTYVKGAYDFDKLSKVLSILGPEFKREWIIDVGANVGTICIPAVGQDLFARALAFEPEPFNYQLLIANININGLCEKIEPHNIALGQKAGEELKFELSETNYGDHRISISDADGMDNEASRKTISVKSEPLDSFLANIDVGNSLIWIDTQGFEGFVLKGGENSLKNTPPLVIEFWPYGMKRSGSYTLLKNVILSSGYRFIIDLNGEEEVAKLNEASLDKIYEKIGEDGWFTDLLIY